MLAVSVKQDWRDSVAAERHPAARVDKCVSASTRPTQSPVASSSRLFHNNSEFTSATGSLCLSWIWFCHWVYIRLCTRGFAYGGPVARNKLSSDTGYQQTFNHFKTTPQNTFNEHSVYCELYFYYTFNDFLV